MAHELPYAFAVGEPVTNAVRPRKLPYKPVIGELENRQTERFL
jgi:hypothetical protein